MSFYCTSTYALPEHEYASWRYTIHQGHDKHTEDVWYEGLALRGAPTAGHLLVICTITVCHVLNGENIM